MWFSKLSLGEVQRVGANQFLPAINICDALADIPETEETKHLPRDCPVPEGQRVPFQTTIGGDLWNSLEDWRDTVVGASGELEMRVYDGSPCGMFDFDCEPPQTLLGLTLPFSIDEAPATEVRTETEAPCIDENEGCKTWAKDGECDRNAAFMQQRCRRSCDSCDPMSERTPNALKPANVKEEPAICTDGAGEACASWAHAGECEKNKEFMLQQCQKSCGVCTGPRDEI